MQSQEFDFTPVPPLIDPTHLIGLVAQASQASQSYQSIQWAECPILICLLGRFRVLKAGHPVAVHGKKAPAFLAALATAPDYRLAREALLEKLWPDLKPERAVGTLNTLVYELRRLLSAEAPGGTLGAEEVILYEDGYYRLNAEAGVVVDLRLFETCANLGARQEREGNNEAAVNSYRSAAWLYRSELFPDFDMDDEVREHLRLLYLHALGRLAEYYYTLGDYAICAEAVRRFLTAEPYQEDAHRLMMYCSMRLGQRAQALRQFRRCERLLRAEFSAKPEAATVALYNQVIDPDGNPEGISFPVSPDFFQKSKFIVDHL